MCLEGCTEVLILTGGEGDLVISELQSDTTLPPTGLGHSLFHISQ